MTIHPIASGSSGNAYLIREEGCRPLLIECGVPWPRLRPALVEQPAACLVSHEHGDHAGNVRRLAAAGVRCYMSAGTAMALNLLPGQFRILRSDYDGARPDNVAGWKVRAVRTLHDAAEAVAFFVRSPGGDRLAYVTDAMFVPAKFAHLTHVMVEANYSLERLRGSEIDDAQRQRILHGHMSLETALGFLRANDLSRVREIWLLHLSQRHADPGEFADAARAATGKPVFVAGASRPRPERRTAPGAEF